MLSRSEAQPGRKVATTPKHLGRWCQGGQRRRDQGTDAWDSHQPSCGVVFAGTTGDLGIKIGDAFFEVIEDCHQCTQRRPHRLGQDRSLDFDQRDEPTCICRPLRHDLAELRQMPTEGVDRLCPLSDQKLADRLWCTNQLVDGFSLSPDGLIPRFP